MPWAHRVKRSLLSAQDLGPQSHCALCSRQCASGHHPFVDRVLHRFRANARSLRRVHERCTVTHQLRYLLRVVPGGLFLDLELRQGSADVAHAHLAEFGDGSLGSAGNGAQFRHRGGLRGAAGRRTLACRAQSRSPPPFRGRAGIHKAHTRSPRRRCRRAWACESRPRRRGHPRWRLGRRSRIGARQAAAGTRQINFGTPRLGARKSPERFGKSMPKKRP
jgi:hypothetical protein